MKPVAAFRAGDRQMSDQFFRLYVCSDVSVAICVEEKEILDSRVSDSWWPESLPQSLDRESDFTDDWL